MELFNIDTRELMESQNAERILNVYTEGKALILIVAHKDTSQVKGKKPDASTIKKSWGSFLGPESLSEARSVAPERWDHTSSRHTWILQFIIFDFQPQGGILTSRSRSRDLVWHESTMCFKTACIFSPVSAILGSIIVKIYCLIASLILELEHRRTSTCAVTARDNGIHQFQAYRCTNTKPSENNLKRISDLSRTIYFPCLYSTSPGASTSSMSSCPGYSCRYKYK